MLNKDPQLTLKDNLITLSPQALSHDILKALPRMNVPNDVTAAPFSMSFLQLAAEKKTPKTAHLEIFLGLLILKQL